MGGTQLFRERRVCGSACDRCDLVAELVRELNGEVPQTADADHGNKVAGTRTATAQCSERGDSRAEQRRGLRVAETVRHCRQRLHRSNHVLLVSAVIADAGNFPVPAIAEISTPALEACAV